MFEELCVHRRHNPVQRQIQELTQNVLQLPRNCDRERSQAQRESAFAAFVLSISQAKIQARNRHWQTSKSAFLSLSPRALIITPIYFYCAGLHGVLVIAFTNITLRLHRDNGRCAFEAVSRTHSPSNATSRRNACHNVWGHQGDFPFTIHVSRPAACHDIIAPVHHITPRTGRHYFRHLCRSRWCWCTFWAKRDTTRA